MCHNCRRRGHGGFIYLFGGLRRFQHCTGHITMGSWKGKQLPAFPLEAVSGIETRPQRWEVRVLPLCHRGPQVMEEKIKRCANGIDK